MLEFNDFCEIMCDSVRDKLPEDWNIKNISLHTTEKNNGCMRTGICIQKADSNVRPVLYLEEYYDGYLEGQELDELSESVVESFLEADRKSPICTGEELKEFNKIRDQIVMELINYKDNAQQLMGRPHRKIDDLAVVYAIEFCGEFEGIARAKLLNEHMEMYGVAEEKLYDLALANTRRLYPPFLMNVDPFELLEGKSTNILVEGKNEYSNGMYALTNVVKQHGAVSILYPDVLHQIQEIVGEDYYMIPSSIHEMLFVGKSWIDPKELGEGIREINEAEVNRQEWLSDHLYEYDFEKETLVSVKESMVKTKDLERG